MKRFQERTKEWVRSVISDKTKLAVALLILGLAVGTSIGFGALTQSQSRLVFDLMFLLTMIYLLISTIRKRHAAGEGEAT